MKNLIITLCFLSIATTAQAYTFTIDIPNEKAVTVLNNCAAYLNYQDEIINPDNLGELIPNPVSKKATVLGKLKEFVKAMNEGGRTMIAVEAARQEAIEQAEIDTEGITVE